MLITRLPYTCTSRLTVDDIENGGIANTIYSDRVLLQASGQVLDFNIILTVFQLHFYPPFDLWVRLESWKRMHRNNLYLRSVGLKYSYWIDTIFVGVVFNSIGSAGRRTRFASCHCAKQTKSVLLKWDEEQEEGWSEWSDRNATFLYLLGCLRAHIHMCRTFSWVAWQRIIHRI